MYKKKVIKDIGAFTLATGGLAIGSKVVSKIDPAYATGFQAMGGFLPVIGTAVGAGYTIKSLDMLNPKKKKRELF